jgi:acetoin utilization deacetylase AcuC-like enzyme
MKIKVIYSNKYKMHNPPYEIYDGVKEAYAEKPERIDSIIKVLRKNKFEMISPIKFPLKNILDIHQKEYVDYLRRRSTGLKRGKVLYPSDFIMDTYTPIVSGTYKAAVESVNIALTGAKRILSKDKVMYALCRPPGHHAQYKVMGGYCYFNNVSIAANFLSKYGKVAILDIDFHHGNGTQSIFYERSDVFYISIHADPHKRFPYSSGFPNEKGKGVGLGFNKNYPLSLGATDEQYVKILEKALKDIKEFNPKFLIVSAGFDTYEKDPIGGFKLTGSFYKTIGKKIKELDLPTLIVQEGGYFVEDLGKIALSLLQGFA